jgi:hypothetical protein
MQILINVPDTLPKPLIQKRIKQLEKSLVWALLAERVANNPVHLAGYSEHIKKICRNLDKALKT